MQRITSFIGGEFAPAFEQNLIESLNPSTGKPIAAFASSTPDDIDRAIAAARAAFASWSRDSKETRIKVLLKIAEEIERRIQEFAEAEALDQGKPVWLAHALDIPQAAHSFRIAAQELNFASETSSNHPGQGLNFSMSEPLGVCALIVPWNFPLMLLARKIAPAIAAGNCVVCKPSEITSYSAFLFARMIQHLNIPPGVINIVFGNGSETGMNLVKHPGIDSVSFTGGTATGTTIAAATAAQLKRASMELGGKNPCVLFPDCDLDEAVSSALRSAFMNSGQVCLATSRFIVHQDIAPAFQEKLAAKMARVTIGDPMQRRTYMGPLVSAPHLAKVQSFVQAARSSGCEVIGGDLVPLEGELAGGYFMKPCLILKSDPHSPAAQEEIFGPVATVHTFANQEEALNLANGVRYGLAAGVWTKDLNLAQSMARSVDAGIIWVNSWLARDQSLSAHGSKQSAYGSGLGEDTIQSFSKRKCVTIAGRAAT